MFDFERLEFAVFFILMNFFNVVMRCFWKL
jgi:hypothetical protein